MGVVKAGVNNPALDRNSGGGGSVVDERRIS